MFKKLRRNSSINGLFRIPIKFLERTVPCAIESLSNRWQISGTVNLRILEIDFKMHSECDDPFVNQLYFNKRLDEENDLRLFVSLAKRCKTILDIGAHTGLYSVLSSKSNPKATVYAFEPYHINKRRLELNCALNGLSNVRIFGKAIGGSIGLINFSVPAHDQIIDVTSANAEFSRSFYQDQVQWKQIEVEQTTIDALSIDELANIKIDLIKIDVESYEMEVLNGMQRVLATHKPDILVESFIDNERKSFFEDLLKKFDYVMYVSLEGGMLRLDNGIEPGYGNRNFFLSTMKSRYQYTPHLHISAFPDVN